MEDKLKYWAPVLDHGAVILRNVAGPTRRPEAEFDADDIDPADSARMSFDKMGVEFLPDGKGGLRPRTREDDLKLARYLMANLHTGPWEMIEVWIEMKLPIFVARQWVRHRTHSLNEVSGRYVKLPAEWYIPSLEHVEFQAENKKQGGRFVDLNDPVQVAEAEAYRKELSEDCARSYAAYERTLARGIAMEQARNHLHLNHYTHWLWKQDLHNLMHLLSLRVHGHAQWEIQQYAEASYQHLKKVLPHSMQVFDDYRRRA